MNGEMENVVFQSMENMKNIALKNILNMVDVILDPEERFSRRREKLRKTIMDEINNLYRYFLGEQSER